jgi:hypothetical protein
MRSIRQPRKPTVLPQSANCLCRYTVPTLVTSFAYHAAVAFLQYGQAMKGNGAPYYFACVVNGVIASVGLWCFLFASDGGHISRKVCFLMQIAN